MSTFKKATAILLPTSEKAFINLNRYRVDKPILNFDREIAGYTSNTYQELVSRGYQPQHLYITSDDEIKEGDWYIHSGTEHSTGSEYHTLNQCHKSLWRQDLEWFIDGMYATNCKKIIATTDSSLTHLVGYNNVEQSLPQPSQSFIQKYIKEYNKGRRITDVLVEYEDDGKMSYPDVRLLKVNPKNNTVTIKTKKDSWDREEVVELIHKAFKAGYERSHSGYPNTDNHTKPNVDNWIKDNI
jgi:hypothetical protein